MSELRTDFKDDVLDITQNEKRRYRVIHNEDGTISLEDATVYVQKGDNFGANELNEMNRVTNEMLGVNEKLEGINAHTKKDISSEDGTHNIRYSDKTLQIKENDNWQNATTDIYYGNTKIKRVQYAQELNRTNTDGVYLKTKIITAQYQQATVYEDVIHAFTAAKHYTFDGENVTEIGASPIAINAGFVTNYEGCVQLFYNNKRYKYDGEYWTTLGDTPYEISFKSTIHRGKIHHFANNKHYVFDGETSTELGTLPRTNTNYHFSQIFDYKDTLYAMYMNSLYKYDDDTNVWSIAKTFSEYKLFPANTSPWAVIENKLYVGCNAMYSTSYAYTNFSALSIVDLDTLTVTQGCSATKYDDVNLAGDTFVAYKGVLYMLGETEGIMEYKANTWWYAGGIIPYNYGELELVKFKGEEHILGICKIRPQGDTTYYSYKQHIKNVDGEWVEDVPCPVNWGRTYGLVVADDEKIHIMGSNSNSEVTSTSANSGTTHYVFDGEVWSEETSLPTASNSAMAVMFKGELHLLRIASGYLTVYVYRNNEWVQIFYNGSYTGFDRKNTIGVNSMNVFVYKNQIHMMYNLYWWTWDDENGMKVMSDNNRPNKIWNVKNLNSYDNEVFIFGAAPSNADGVEDTIIVSRFVDGATKKVADCMAICNQKSLLLERNGKIYITNIMGVADEYEFVVDSTTILRME